MIHKIPLASHCLVIREGGNAYEQFTTLVANACQLAGFRSAMLHNRPGQKFPNITYGCHRGTQHCHRPQLLNPDQEKRRSRQPILPTAKGNVCSFRFTIYFSREHSCWFIPLSMPGVMKHTGHAEAPPSQVQIAAGRLDKTELKLIKQMLDKFIPISAIQSLIKCRTGKTFDYHQFYHLNNHKLARMKLMPSAGGTGTPGRVQRCKPALCCNKLEGQAEEASEFPIQLETC